MARNDVLKRYLDAGMELVSLAQSRADELQARAEELVRDLVKAGEVQADQAREAVADLVDRSRRNSERLLETIRAEVREQVTSLGLASQEDLDRMEDRISGLVSAATANLRELAEKAPSRGTAKRAAKKAGGARKTAAKQAGGAKKTAAKKVTAAKKTATKRAGTAKKATTKKAGTAKRTAKKTTAKKA